MKRAQWDAVSNIMPRFILS